MLSHEAYFNQLSIPCHSMNFDGTLLYVNSAWSSLLGYDQTEVANTSFFDYLPAYQRDSLSHKLRKALERKSSPPIITLKIRHQQGHAVIVKFNASITETPDGANFDCFLTDITQEHVTQDRYRQLFTHSSSGVVIFEAINDGEDFLFVDVNPRVEEIEKTSKTEMIGKTVAELFPGAPDTAIFDGFQKAYRTGKTITVPVTLYKDDKRIGYRINTITKLPSGQLYVIYSDESAIEISRRLLDTILNTINLIVCTTLRGEELYSCNDYFLRIAGYTNLEEFKQNHRCLCDLFVEDKRRGYIGKTVDGLQWTDYIMRHQANTTVKTKLHAQGDPKHEKIFSIHVELLDFDEEERMLVIMHDITIQEQYQTSLRNEIAHQTGKIQHLYELLSQSEKISHFGVIESTLQHPEGSWSDGVYALIEDIDKTVEASIDTWVDHIHPEDLDKVCCRYHTDLKPGDHQPVEYRIRTIRGNIRHIHSLSQLISSDDESDTGHNIQRLVIVLRDISQEKQMEQLTNEHHHLLARQQHLDSLREMFKNISHHWRQPLNIITLGSALLRDKFDAGHLASDDLEHFIHTVQQETAYLSQTINQFREISIQTKEPSLTKLHTEIANSVELLRPKLTQNRIELIEDYEAVTIMAIPNELMRVLNGMLENSIESIIKHRHNHPGHVGKIEIVLKRQDDKIRLSLKDNGEGISQEVQEKMFEPYFTTKFQSRGAGLSLSLNRWIINTYFKGEIFLNRDFHEGAEFIIEFPADTHPAHLA